MKIQRLMQICDKLTMIERRMMSQMGDWHEFCRIFKSDVMEIEWKSPEAGCHAGQQMMSRFIQLKKMYTKDMTNWHELRAEMQRKMMAFMQSHINEMSDEDYGKPAQQRTFLATLEICISEMFNEARFNPAYLEI